MAKAKNYINNKTLYSAMIQYRNSLKVCLENDKPKPQVPNYIGQSILLINTNLAKKPNFSGYTYIHDMIGDGVIDCIAAVDNFDPDRTNNPFAYFTQIAWNAFIRRIEKEKKHTYIKHKNFQNSYLTNNLWSESENIHLKSNEYSDDVIRNFENKLTKIKKPSKLVGVEVFSVIEDEVSIIEDEVKNEK